MTYTQPHVRANSAISGEVVDVLGQAAQDAPTPASPATRKTPRVEWFQVLLNISPPPPNNSRPIGISLTYPANSQHNARRAAPRNIRDVRP